MMNKKVVVLVGQPNCGKTSLFNRLTGSNQFVGNWPGVTVEKKEGIIIINRESFRLIDLPGSYTLAPFSLEETITSEYIFKEQVDLILNIVDSTHLERHLFLTLQLLALKKPLIVVLTMIDEIKEEGKAINSESLKKILGVPIVLMIAREGKGVEKLIEEINTTFNKSRKPKPNFKIPVEPSDIYRKSKSIEETVVKILPGQKRSVIKEIWDKLDYFALHQIFGPILFFLVMTLMFWFTFSIGGKLADLLGIFLEKIEQLIMFLKKPVLLSLFQEGIIGGVGNVLLLVPYIAVLFFCFSLLEESGYIGRVAYVMDRLMHRLGLHGKSIIPLILGFGCNVPAIMTARSLDNENDKIKTILMIPFISCSGRLPIFVLFTGAFFRTRGIFVILLLYFLGVIMALLTGFILTKFVFKETSPELVMELSPYRLPYWKNIWRNTYTKVKQYIYKAGTLIFLFSILLWFLSYYPSGSGFGGESSMIGIFGKAISPIFKPLGFDWKMTIALISGFVAKELVLSTMGVLYTGSGSLSSILQATIPSSTVIVFLVFSLLYLPCLATVFTIRSETNSLKWMFFSIAWSLVIAWITSFLFKLVLV